MEYKRFLRNGDYVGLISNNHLQQVSNNFDEKKFVKTEEDSEICILEYMIENYKVEDALAIGKGILDYDPRITYPKDVYFWFQEEVMRTTKEVLGKQVPEINPHWSHIDTPTEEEIDDAVQYSQLKDFYTGMVAVRDGEYYTCVIDNGYSFNNIRVPGGDNFWLLTLDPPASTYDPDKLDYAVGDIVDYNGSFFEATNADVNGNLPVKFNNVIEDDPRNKNLKKHLARLSLYEMYKAISPNNISLTVLEDWKYSMEWLNKVNKLKINPMIDRKSGGKDNKGVSVDWAIATFAPNTSGNAWMT